MKKLFVLVMIVTLLGVFLAGYDNSKVEPQYEDVASAAPTHQADDSSKTLSQASDPPVGMHYSDVGELVSDTPPSGQTETVALVEPTLEAAQIERSKEIWSAVRNRPFDPRGSTVMVGTWGRNLMNFPQAKTQAEAIKVAEFNYDEYVFFSDGSFSDIGHWWGDVRNLSGWYRLDDDGKTLHLWFTKRYENGQFVDLVPTDTTYSIATEYGYQGFHDFNGLFCKGLYWDKTLKRYRDESGKFYSPGP